MAFTFSDFGLSREEDISSGVVTDDAEKDPHEFRDDLSEAEDGVTTSDEMERVANIVQVVESLESFKENLYKYEGPDTVMSREDAMVLGSRIAFTYANHGVPMSYPVHMSTESMAHFDTSLLEASVEQLDYHIDMLSTEAMGIIERFVKNFKEIYGNEMDKLNNIAKNIRNVIKRVEKSDRWATGTITVENGSLITIGGKVQTKKVIDNISQVVEAELKGGIFNTYINGLESINSIVSGSKVGDMESVKKKIISSRLFSLGRPFVEAKSNDEEKRTFEAFVSDGFQLRIDMPTGVGRLIPHAELSYRTFRYQTNPTDKNGLTKDMFRAGRRKGKDITTQAASKEEVLAALNAYLRVVEDAMNEKSVTGIVQRFIERVGNLTQDKPQYDQEKERIDKERKARSNEDFKLWLYTLPLKLIFPPLFVAGVVIGKNENDLAFGFSLRKDGDSHVWKQSAYKAEGFAKVKRAFGLGLLGLIGSRIWSRWSLQFKNQALTFCYSLMRDAYGGIYSVGDALIEYADTHIDNA